MSANIATPRELAAKYGVAPSTFMSWFHAGKFPALVAEGKVYRFDPDAVAKGLEKTEPAKKQPGMIPTR